MVARYAGIDALSSVGRDQRDGVYHQSGNAEWCFLYSSDRAVVCFFFDGTHATVRTLDFWICFRRLLLRPRFQVFASAGRGERKVSSDSSGRQLIRIRWVPLKPRLTCIVVGGR